MGGDYYDGDGAGSEDYYDSAGSEDYGDDANKPEDYYDGGTNAQFQKPTKVKFKN